MKKVELPKLGYEYDALEPFIDAKTMQIHHSKHHQAYIDKYNAAMESHPEINDSPEEILSNPDRIPTDIKAAVRNHGGGYINHKLFWEILKKDTPLSGEVKDAIVKQYESIDNFKKLFTTAATTLFGSGWAWLVVNKEKKLQIVQTHNQDSPLTIGLTPILGLDVWEHAYYLNYQNKRPAYVEAFFNIINWDKVNELYKVAIK